MKSTKNLILFLVAIALGVITILLHKTINQELFLGGASWMRSKITPYILCWVSALLITIFSINAFKSKAIGVIIGITLSLAIIGVDFSQNIIYQGDFSNNSIEIKSNYHQLRPNTLSVIAIPGCPFCHESVDMLKIIHKRSPNLKIEFLVCSEDTNSLNDYTQTIGDNFDLALFENLEELKNLGVDGFPTFIFTDNNGNKQLWGNDTFGAPAKDFVEKSVR